MMRMSLMKGETPFSPGPAGIIKAADYIGQIMAAFSQSANPASSIVQTSDDSLTHRELDILEMPAQRLQDKEIAEILSIGPNLQINIQRLSTLRILRNLTRNLKWLVQQNLVCLGQN